MSADLCFTESDVLDRVGHKGRISFECQNKIK